MAQYYLQIMDGKQAEVPVQAANQHEAVNDALNALHAFVSRNFPPPDNISIDVLSETRSKIATLKFAFEIQYAEGMRV